MRRGGTPPTEVAAAACGAPTGGVVAGVVGVRLLKRWCSRGPTSEALLEEEDEWFPLSASAGRKGGCESSSDTKLGAGGGDGSADGSRQGAGLLGANRGRWAMLGPKLGPLLGGPLAPSTAVAAGAALVVVGVLTTGDGELVTAGVTGAEAADAGCGGCGSAGCHVGPLCSRATAAGDGGPRRAAGGLERAPGSTHGAAATAAGGAEEAAAAAALVVVVGVQLAVVTAVGGAAAAAPAGVVVVVAAVDAGLAAAWPRLGACGGLGW